MGIFSKNHVPDPNVKRNTFDLSFQNNLTMQLGKLYPCFCKEVLPGDTFKIDTAFGLRFMPLVFPVQTKMRADVHFFYVRNRNLWSEWPNFIGDNTNKDVPPYLALDTIKSHYMRTGSLGDYMGLPTTIVGSTGSVVFDEGVPFIQSNPEESLNFYFLKGWQNLDYFPSVPEGTQGAYTITSEDFIFAQISPHEYHPLYSNTIDKTLYTGDIVRFQGRCIAPSDVLNSIKDNINWYLVPTDGAEDILNNNTLFRKGVFDVGLNGYFSLSFECINRCNFQDWNFCNVIGVANNQRQIQSTLQENDVELTAIYFDDDKVSEFADDSFADFDKLPKISALPFRAYESIYNAFYRDQRNNPYIVNGEEKPNEYIPTKLGGEDKNIYDFHHRNWEQDFLTSALPSPQMGAAPLVGLTSSGVASFQSEDGTMYQVKLKVADDGDTVVGAQYTSNIPNDVARSIVNVASSGISINDFRAVNSLQRWLEANFRKGLKYKDQIASHFGVETSYAELDMPEFLGGCSQSVDIQQINQTSETTEGNPLGSYAGQAYAVGSSNNTIQHYCDEHGFIIGIISVVPVPSYSQLLPKHFLKRDTLDYYFPEFGHIGMQPIPYSEVCPLQAIQLGVPLSNTFGYQRAWYDYLASTDEVHGEFRTTLKDFLYGRVFKSVPSLSPDFLTVSEDDLNNIFAVNEGDHILGQIHFQVHAKRPIPRFGIPRLE